MNRFARPRGFSFIELLVVLAIGVILVSILWPYVNSVRESSRRIRCQENLRELQLALTSYAKDNGNNFPRVRYDKANNPNGFVAYTGADAADPFAADSAVRPNDVTASLWLLVREGYVKSPAVFICPSAGGRADPLTDAGGKPTDVKHRGNFRGPANLGYSYASPFSEALDYRLNDTQPADFAVIADKNPGPPSITAVPFDAPPLEQAKANSRNHAGAGQSVLYADGHVDFQRTVYCGYGNDNIYTALSRTPLTGETKPSATATGFAGPSIGPSWQADSYLAPME